MPLPARVAPCRCSRGQALVEALAVLGVLGSLALAVGWLGRVQDLDLQLLHASRRMAFSHAHQGLDPSAMTAGLDGFLQAAGHEWKTRQGDAWLHPAAPGAEAPFEGAVRSTTQAPAVQVGDPIDQAAAWRTELRLGDAQVWLAEAGAHVGQDATSARLHDFDRLALHLKRRTAILRGSGAAAADTEVQAVLAASAQAWGRLADTTQKRGRAAQQRLQGVDAAWGRPLPDWDWLSAWAGRVPEPYLQPWSQP